MKNILNKYFNSKNLVIFLLSYIITVLFTMKKNAKVIDSKSFLDVFINQDSLLCLVLFVLAIFFVRNVDFSKLNSFDRREKRIINIFSLVFALINTIGMETFRNSFNRFWLILFLIVLIMSYIVFNFIIKFIYYKFNKVNTLNYDDIKATYKKFDKIKFLKILIPIFVLRFILFLILFPGNFTWDSMYSIKEGIGALQLSNSHPYLYVYLVGVFGKIGLKYFSSVGIGVGIFNFLSLIFTSMTFAILLYKVFEINVNRKINIAIYVYFCINPYFIIYSFTLYKDVLLGNFLVLFLVLMINIIYKSDIFFNNKLSILYFICVIFGVSILHRKAIIYVVVGIIALLFKINKKYIKKFLIFVLTSIAFSFLISSITYKLLKPVESYRKYDYLSTRFQQLASAVKYHPESFSKDELELCDKLFDLKTIKNKFDVYSSDNIKYKMHVDGDKFKIHESEFFKLWFKMYKKHPKTYIDALINLSLSYYYPYKERESMVMGDYFENMYKDDVDFFSDNHKRLSYVPINNKIKEEYGYFDKGWKQNTDFSKMYTLKYAIKGICYTITSYPIISVFLKVGFITWSLILALGYAIMTKNKKIIPIALLCISIVLTCVYSPLVNYYRYSFLIFITVPILLPFLFVRDKKVQK